jgi:hypothetical protein
VSCHALYPLNSVVNSKSRADNDLSVAVNEADSHVSDANEVSSPHEEFTINLAR